MINQDLHTHSLYDDGTASPLAMAESAQRKGFSVFGCSLHSPQSGEAASWSGKEEEVAAFQKDMAAVKAKLAPKLHVYTGLEYDIQSVPAFDGFDYVIGGCHEISAGVKRGSVDWKRSAAKQMIEEAFEGDSGAAASVYFAQMEKLAVLPQVDAIAHFDLITKFNEPDPLYDTRSGTYRRAAEKAMEKLVAAGKIFEINSGAVSRGYRTSFYPSREILCLLREMEGKIFLSSDAHTVENVGNALEHERNLARSCGFRESWILTPGGFAPEKL